MKLFTLSFVFIFTDVGHLTVWSRFKALANKHLYVIVSGEWRWRPYSFAIKGVVRLFGRKQAKILKIYGENMKKIL